MKKRSSDEATKRRRGPPPLTKGGAGGVRPAFKSRTNRAFSLAELMIAIAILGLGLVMVATMFPVGWIRARDLADFTASQSCVSDAETKVSQLCRVDAPRSQCDVDGNPLTCELCDTDGDGDCDINDTKECFCIGPGSSFAGDLLVEEPTPVWDVDQDGDLDSLPFRFLYSGGSPAALDTQVHALNLENVLANDDSLVDEDTWQIENLYDFGSHPTLGPTFGRFGNQTNRFWYGMPQVTFEERIYPSIPFRRIGNPALWSSLLDSRRFGWAVLHRLADPPFPDTPGQQYSEEAALSKARIFTAYYITLRRAEPTHRFAQQDRPGMANTSGGLVDTFPGNADKSIINELPAADDVSFPAPWLVPLQLTANATFAPPGTCVSTGTPGVADVLVLQNDPASPVLQDMLPPGSWFVVRSTGNVYQVAEREYINSVSVRSRQTLDREVQLNDVECVDADSDGNADPFVQLVWIYPPRVEREGSITSFLGPSPVVAVDIRTLTILP